MFINLKGGVAKTTNAVAVAECLADAGHSVLVIDADHQCMAGELLLGESRLLYTERHKKTLHDLLAAMLDDEFHADQIAEFVEPNGSNIAGGYKNLSVIPCSVRIDDFQTNMAKARHGYRSTEEFWRIFNKRRNALRRWFTNHYHFTIIDCPPSLSIQVRALLPVADAFVLPSVPDRLSVRGSLWLLDRLRRSNVKLQGLGTLWSLYRQQNAMHRRVIEATNDPNHKLHRALPRPFETVIPNASAIADTTEPNRRPNSFSEKYTSQFAKLYRSLCSEIVKRSQWQPADSTATVKAV